MPLHSHYSFYKACLLFGLEPIIVPPVEGSLATVDPAAIAAAVRDDTILIVGTAGSWPYGTIDPIKEMSEIALGNEIPMHVDACFGGYILPFLELAGYYDEPLEPWDFRNRGVTTISADCHKNGMAPPPASTLLWRTPDLRDIATLFMLPDGILSGSKGAGPYAATWTTIQSIGLDGYIQLARHSMKLCEEAKAGILSIPGMKIVPGSRCNVFCAYSDTYDLRPVLVEMTKGGWQIPPQEMPGMAGVMGMGIATMPSNDGYIGQLVVDLREAIKRAAVPLGSVHADYPVEAYGLDLSVYPSHPV
jgi:glutamate/tyrosine decarboxylase-like PLP-dependent enzyme